MKKAGSNKDKFTLYMKEIQSEKDYLWLNIRELHYFRGLLRAVEARFYQDIELPRPILDVGCGDGQFATIAFDSPIDDAIVNNLQA